MKITSPTDAPPLDLTDQVPASMRAQVRGLASLKVAIDRLARGAHDGMGQAFLDDWMDHPHGHTCAYHGHTFLYALLPFMRWE